MRGEHLILMGNLQLAVRSKPYQPSEWFFISMFQLVCRAGDAVATREVPHEKNVDLNSVQVKILKSVTRMIKRSGGI